MSAEKIPEDPDGDGLTRRPTVEWLLWVTDAITEFVNGFLDGLLPGVGGASIGAAVTRTTSTNEIVTNATMGFFAGAALNGLKEFHGWRRTSPMPNPFRASKPKPPQ